MTECESSACVVCGVSQLTKKCTGCGKVAYCGKKHQKAHWKEHKADCCCWKVDFHDDKGRFVRATRKIKAGEIIFIESPRVVAPRTLDPTPVCPECFFPVTDQQRHKCPKCDIPMCGDKCISTNTFHADECSIVSSRRNPQQSPFQDYDLLAIIRFLAWKKKDPLVYKELTSLANHKSNKIDSLDWPRISSMAERLENTFCIDGISKVEIEDAICILDTNSYQVLSKLTCDSLCGLYPKAALLNHTCYKANTRPLFSANEYVMKIVAVDDIELGQDINTSYLGPFFTTLQRRAILKRGKSFECNCERCCDPTELGSYASAVKCKSCDKGWLLSSNPLVVTGAPLQCNNCPFSIETANVVQMDNKLTQELNKINRDSLDNIDKFLTVYSNHLHPNHSFLLQLKQWLLEGIGRLPGITNQSIRSLLQRKLFLARDMLKATERLEATESFLRGVISLELCDALVQLARMNAMESNPLAMLDEAKSCLDLSNRVFQHEDEEAPEGALIKKAKELSLLIDQFHQSLQQ